MVVYVTHVLIDCCLLARGRHLLCQLLREACDVSAMMTDFHASFLTGLF